MDSLEERLQKFSYSAPSFQTDERIKNSLRQALQHRPQSILDLLLKRVGIATACVLFVCFLVNSFLIRFGGDNSRTSFSHLEAYQASPSEAPSRADREWLREIQGELSSRDGMGERSLSPWYLLWLKNQQEEKESKNQKDQDTLWQIERKFLRDEKPL